MDLPKRLNMPGRPLLGKTGTVVALLRYNKRRAPSYPAIDARQGAMKLAIGEGRRAFACDLAPHPSSSQYIKQH
jgi:hypothetical protein